MLRAGIALALLVAAVNASAAQELRTLFHTAEERERLDRLRRGEPEASRAEKRGPPAVTGFVKRSDGRVTVWLDGRPVTMSAAAAAPYLDRSRVRDGRQDSRAIDIRPSR